MIASATLIASTTVSIRSACRKAGHEMDKPLPAGSVLYLYEGKATGHGRLAAGTPLGEKMVDLSGLIPARVEYHEDSWLRHSIRHGEVVVARLYHDGCAGGEYYVR